jgi:hypothetical protein
MTTDNVNNVTVEMYKGFECEPLGTLRMTPQMATALVGTIVDNRTIIQMEYVPSGEVVTLTPGDKVQPNRTVVIYLP